MMLPSREKACSGIQDRRVAPPGLVRLFNGGDQYDDYMIKQSEGLMNRSDIPALSLALQAICSHAAAILRYAAPQAQSMFLISQPATATLWLPQI